MIHNMRFTIFFVILVCTHFAGYGNHLVAATIVTSYSKVHEYGYQYVSPRPQAEYLPSQSRILVRFASVSPYDLTNLSSFISVTGDRSGTHSGRTRIASDSSTVIFNPAKDFSKHETVTLTLSPQFNASAQGEVEYIKYEFYISNSKAKLQSRHLSLPSTNTSSGEFSHRDYNVDTAMKHPNVIQNSTGEAMIMSNSVSVPSDFPHVNVMVNDNPDSGYIFIDNSSNVQYAMILANDGSPVWYKRGSVARDFKVQKNGTISYTTGGSFSVFDQDLNELRSCRAVNGYSTDNHELQILKNGNYLLIGIRSETVDMTQYIADGKKDAKVNETVLQEFTSEGDLIFQWRAWDNYDILGLENWSYDDKPTGNSIRFPHMNSVDIDRDGHIILSAKRLSEITKIHRKTGEIIWRLGGDCNEFDINDPLGQFNVQHDVRVVGANRYSIFDNHYLHKIASSRVVEYEIDPVAKTADMVWVYEENPRYQSHHMGNAQRLPNNNTFINWVETKLPKATEVRPDGSKAYEMNWIDSNSKSYRVFRFPWDGVVEKPYLIVESGPSDVTLIFNKFGDADVDFYRIYGGKRARPTTILGTSETTLKKLTDLENNSTYYFRVTAVSTSGEESVFSNEESARVHFTYPAENLLTNADFSYGKTEWKLDVEHPASAEWRIEKGECVLDIADGGSQLEMICLQQTGLSLIKGNRYVLQFDVHGSAPRTIEVKVEQSTAPHTNYSKNGLTYIMRTPKQRSYEFEMEDATDHDAGLAVYVGGAEAVSYTHLRAHET